MKLDYSTNFVHFFNICITIGLIIFFSVMGFQSYEKYLQKRTVFIRLTLSEHHCICIFQNFIWKKWLYEFLKSISFLSKQSEEIELQYPSVTFCKDSAFFDGADLDDDIRNISRQPKEGIIFLNNNLLSPPPSYSFPALYLPHQQRNFPFFNRFPPFLPHFLS